MSRVAKPYNTSYKSALGDFFSRVTDATRQRGAKSFHGGPQDLLPGEMVVCSRFHGEILVVTATHVTTVGHCITVLRSEGTVATVWLDQVRRV